MHPAASLYRKDTFYGRTGRGWLPNERSLLNRRVEHSESFAIDDDVLSADTESTEWEEINQLLSETISAVVGTVNKVRQVNTTVINILDKDDNAFSRHVTAVRYKALRGLADKMSELAQEYEQDRQQLLTYNDEDEPHSTKVLSEELVAVMGNSAVTIRQYVGNLRLVFGRLENTVGMDGQFLTTVSGDELWERRTKFYEYAL